ncbi:MAG: efflux RND transporter periplasmic adaptor subunit [Wenzhouxiangellaceae bacterium]
MDRKIEQKKWPLNKLLAAGGVLLLAILAYSIFASPAKSTLTVEPDRVRVARVETGEFEEYIPVVGNVQPEVTVYLDLEEGGIVEQVHVEGGNRVEAGDLILSLSNSTVQKQNVDSETRLLENLDRLRNSKLALTEKDLTLQEQLLDLNYQIQDLEKTIARYDKLLDSPAAQLSQQEYETTADNLAYQKDKRDLLKQRIREESILREEQNEQINKSIKLVNRSLEVLTEIMDSLQVRAPISGYLSSMSAEVGQSFAQGQRIGQIDQLDSFKVQAEIDQYYLSRVELGQVGTFEFDNQEYQLSVSKIYPEVDDDMFRVDMEFQSTAPTGISRGQSLQIDLSLSESSMSKVLSKGGFYRYTSGRWVYRLTDDGLSAERIDIVSGRQNPKYFEVLEGLDVGDEVIISSYDIFNDVDVLNFSEPVQG